MFNSKKCIGSYIYILGILAIPMSLLLVVVISATHGSDHELCRSLEYNFEATCRLNGIGQVTITNNGEESFLFILNGRKSESYRLNPEQTSRFSLERREITTAEFIPMIQDEGRLYECRGLRERVSVEMVRQC